LTIEILSKVHSIFSPSFSNEKTDKLYFLGHCYKSYFSVIYSFDKKLDCWSTDIILYLLLRLTQFPDVIVAKSSKFMNDTFGAITINLILV
jgi:hypothetical protein